MDWIINNKEWLFSGVAVAVPVAIIGWISTSTTLKQKQKGGKGSTNMQIGGNITFTKGEKNARK